MDRRSVSKVDFGLILLGVLRLVTNNIYYTVSTESRLTNSLPQVAWLLIYEIF